MIEDMNKYQFVRNKRAEEKNKLKLKSCRDYQNYGEKHENVCEIFQKNKGSINKTKEQPKTKLL